MTERLDKTLALNLHISRKDSKKLIKNGSVTINGSVSLLPEAFVNTDSDIVLVDGKELSLKKFVYLMMNKPTGVLSAARDKSAKTVVQLVPPDLSRRGLFPAGRLDKDSSGLMILTDDGALAHRMLSPAHHVFKTYFVTLERPLGEADKRLLEGGILLSDGLRCRPAIIVASSKKAEATISIREGKYHQVRRMVAACENRVLTLKRIKIGELELDENLGDGECRPLCASELELLFMKGEC